MNLDVEQDLGFPGREERAKRLGWFLMTAFVVAGLVGLLGAGPISSTAEASPDGLVTVVYDEVIRLEADESLTFRLGPEAVVDGSVTLDVTGPWVAAIDWRGTSPTPSSQVLLPDGVRLVFDAAPAEEPLTVDLTYRAARLWSQDGTATVQQDDVTYSQFVLP